MLNADESTLGDSTLTFSSLSYTAYTWRPSAEKSSPFKYVVLSGIFVTSSDWTVLSITSRVYSAVFPPYVTTYVYLPVFVVSRASPFASTANPADNTFDEPSEYSAVTKTPSL